MSCCGLNYCQFEFPEGPPLTDYAVTHLEAKYLFLPYGTLLEKGEIVRIWLENGKTKTVEIEAKIPLEILPAGPEVVGQKFELPWQLIALDTGIEYEELMDWYHHPQHNPKEQAVVLVFKHPVVVKPTLKLRWLEFLYRIRNL